MAKAQAQTDTRKRKMYIDVEKRINEAFFGMGVDDLSRIEITRGEGRYNRVTFNLLIDKMVVVSEVTIEELSFVATGINTCREFLAYAKVVPESKLFRKMGSLAQAQAQTEQAQADESEAPKGVARISRRRIEDPKVTSSSKRSVKARNASRGSVTTKDVPQIRSNPESRKQENRAVARKGGMEVRRDVRTPSGMQGGQKNFLQRSEPTAAPELPTFLKRSS